MLSFRPLPPPHPHPIVLFMSRLSPLLFCTPYPLLISRGMSSRRPITTPLHPMHVHSFRPCLAILLSNYVRLCHESKIEELHFLSFFLSPVHGLLARWGSGRGRAECETRTCVAQRGLGYLPTSYVARWSGRAGGIRTVRDEKRTGSKFSGAGQQVRGGECVSLHEGGKGIGVLGAWGKMEGVGTEWCDGVKREETKCGTGWERGDQGMESANASTSVSSACESTIHLYS